MATKPVFVRLPEEQVRALEIACAMQGLTKQALVRTALANHLAEGAPGQASVEAGAGDDVLTLDELAGLLRVDVDIVRQRVVARELPGRRLGDTWRFSRTAVMGWLAASEVRERPPTGAEAPRRT